MTAIIDSVFTEKAAKPLGHYSQAIIHKDTVYVSMQLGIVPNQNPINVGSIEEQTKQVLNNIKEILLASGSSMDNILKVTVYISDISLWSKVNQIYTDFFPNHKPARSVIPVNELPHGFQVAMDAIAAI